MVLVDVKQYNSVSLQCYVFITGEFSLQRCYVVSVDGSTVHSSCQSTVFCVLIVRVWLNSAACVVCMSCRQVKVTILGDEPVPVQVDGEAWMQPPGYIRIVHKNRAMMLTRDRVRHMRSSEE